jgi:hypothetical protein
MLGRQLQCSRRTALGAAVALSSNGYSAESYDAFWIKWTGKVEPNAQHQPLKL